MEAVVFIKKEETEWRFSEEAISKLLFENWPIEAIKLSHQQSRVTACRWTIRPSEDPSSIVDGFLSIDRTIVGISGPTSACAYFALLLRKSSPMNVGLYFGDDQHIGDLFLTETTSAQDIAEYERA